MIKAFSGGISTAPDIVDVSKESNNKKHYNYFLFMLRLLFRYENEGVKENEEM